MQAADLELAMLNMNSEQRKNFTLLAMLGGAVTMTILAALAIWLVKASPLYVLYLGLAAHLQIVIVMTGLTAQIVRRKISASKEGFTIEDTNVQPQ